MDEQIKAQWTAALRSGEYEQGQEKLQTILRDEDQDSDTYDEETGRAFCCLGVLCDLAVKVGVVTEQEEYDSVRYGDPSNELGNVYLPDEVMEWAGIGANNPSVVTDYQNVHTSRTLSLLNDDGHPFSEIADLIDAQF